MSRVQGRETCRAHNARAQSTDRNPPDGMTVVARLPETPSAAYVDTSRAAVVARDPGNPYSRFHPGSMMLSLATVSNGEHVPSSPAGMTDREGSVQAAASTRCVGSIGI